MEKLDAFQMKILAIRMRHKPEFLFAGRRTADSGKGTRYFATAIIRGAEIQLVSRFLKPGFDALEDGADALDEALDRFDALDQRDFDWEHRMYLYSGIEWKYREEWERFPEKNLPKIWGIQKYEEVLDGYAAALFKKEGFRNNFAKVYTHCVENFVIDKTPKSESNAQPAGGHLTRP